MHFIAFPVDFFFEKFREREECVHKQSKQDANAKLKARGRKATENMSAKHKAQGSKVTENASA